MSNQSRQRSPGMRIVSILDTSDALIKDDKVAEAVVTPARMDLTLLDGEAFGNDDVTDASAVQTYHVDARGSMIVRALKDHPPVAAYEGGHAIGVAVMGHNDPVSKVSILQVAEVSDDGRVDLG